MPGHLFIAALKNQGSLLFEFFKEDKIALENLINYYKGISNLDTTKEEAQETNNQIIKKEKINFNILYKIKRALGFNL